MRTAIMAAVAAGLRGGTGGGLGEGNPELINWTDYVSIDLEPWGPPWSQWTTYVDETFE